MTDKEKADQIAAAKKFAARLNAWLSTEDRAGTLETLEVNGPQSFSAQQRNGLQGYITKHLIGGEKVKPYAVYVGTKGDLIWRLRPAVPTDIKMANIKHIEIVMKDLNRKDSVKGFWEWADMVIATIEEAVAVSGVKNVARRYELTMDERLADADFASW